MNAPSPLTFPDDFNLADYFLFDRIAEGLGGKSAIRFGERDYTYEVVAAAHARLRVAPRRARACGAGSACSSSCPTRPRSRGSSSARSRAAPSSRWATPTLPSTQTRVPRRLHARDRGGHRSARRRRAPRGDARAAESARGAARLVVPETQRPATIRRCPSGARARRSASSISPHDLAERSPRGEPVPIHRDEPAIWLFTSGSTGEPKANIHTHRDFAFNTEVYAKRHRRLRARRRHGQRPAPLLRLRDRHEPDVPVRGRRDRGPLQRAPDARERSRARSRCTAPPSSRTCRRCSASSSSTTRRSRDAGRAAARPLERPLLALRRRGAPRGAAHALARALRERRLRRHRLGRDVPHLRLEPPRRRQAGLARQGRRGLRAAHPPRRRRRARRAPPCRPARSASCG